MSYTSPFLGYIAILRLLCRHGTNYYFIKILKKEKNKLLLRSKKEVFQPHLPVRLPCYDLALVTSFTLGGSLRLPT